MSLRDLKSNVDITQSLAPSQKTAAGNGVGVDLRGYDSAMAVIDAGAIGGTTPSFTFEIKESDDDATYTAVADTELDGTEPVLTTGGSITRIGYKGSKRYLRVDLKTVSGTSPTLFCSGTVVRGAPHQAPLA